MTPTPFVRPAILVVDDDPGIRDALHLVLEEEYEVVGAADGAKALAILEVRKIDLILLDLVMSPSDGFEVLEQHRSTQQDAPIIVLSALNNAWTAAAAIRLGAVDYVTKPFDDDALLALIRATLSSPTGQHGLTPSKTARKPHVFLAGVQLGIHASLTVLLRPKYRVERSETVVEALAYPNAVPPDVLVVDLTSTGRQTAEVIRRIRTQMPRAHVVVIDDGSQRDWVLSGSCTFRTQPTRLNDLLNEIQAHVCQFTSELPSYSLRVVTALDYLGDHYFDASVRHLGRVVRASPSYLSTLFRAETGMSLRSYINQLRIEAAKWLLLETEEKIESVAARIGLHDASHLSRLFLKHTGDRPGAYRRQQVGDGNASAPRQQFATRTN